MANNDFKENRAKVQRVFLDSGFLIPLSEHDIPYTIVEDKNKDLSNTLKEIVLHKIPISEDSATISYVLNVEMAGKLFSLPPGYKTVEKVLLIFSCNSLYVVMIEMKTLLQGYKNGIAELDKKMKDSMGRIALFLTHYILDIADYDNYSIKYFSLVVYNNENISQAVKDDINLRKNEIVNAFIKGRGRFFVEDPLVRTFVDVIFTKNASSTDKCEIDLETIFDSDHDFVNAMYSDKGFTK